MTLRGKKKKQKKLKEVTNTHTRKAEKSDDEIKKVTAGQMSNNHCMQDQTRVHNVLWL